MEGSPVRALAVKQPKLESPRGIDRILSVQKEREKYGTDLLSASKGIGGAVIDQGSAERNDLIESM